MSPRGESAQRDAVAEERLMARWEPLVRHIAQRFRGAADREDLEQVARVALLRAARRFDPSRGCQFSTFAVPTIEGELRRYVRDRGQPFHVPRAWWELHVRMKQAVAACEREESREPTVGELAERLGVAEEDAARVMGIQDLYHAESLDEAREELEGEVRDTLAGRLGEPDPKIEAVEERLSMQQAMAGLPGRQREILRRRYYQGQSQQRIGRDLGLSQMQISRLERRALAGLRAALV